MRAGFKWRAGKERTTTGIWLWSRAFIRTLPPRPGASADGSRREQPERVALLLMDTQGLWDTHTAQNLTTAIFALSTLISSHVIYNLTGRIQEDALQNLALFSQFGKRVLSEQRARARQAVAAGVEEEEAITASASAAAGAAGSGEGGIADVVASADDAASGGSAGGVSPAAAGGAGGAGGLLRSGSSSASLDVLKSPGERLKQLRQRTSRRIAEAAEAAAAGGGASHPFQRIDLLVRDVQDLASDYHDLAAVEAENAGYLEREVLKRGALAPSAGAGASSSAAGSAAAAGPAVHEDIRSVREVIADAFACVGCFQLPHPGLHVPKPTFDGSLRSLEVDFRALVCQ